MSTFDDFMINEATKKNQRLRDLEMALRQIRGVAPLGIDTYRECYIRIQKIAGDALGITPVAAQPVNVNAGRICPECKASGGPDGVTNCETCAGGFWEQGCEHCGSLEVNPKCPACNGIE